MLMMIVLLQIYDHYILRTVLYVCVYRRILLCILLCSDERNQSVLMMKTCHVWIENLNALFPYQAKRPKKEQGKKVQYCFLYQTK